MIRRDFFELARVLDRARHRGEVLHQRRVHRRRPRPAGWRRWTTSTSRSASTAPTPRRTTPCAATARTTRPAGRWSNLARRRTSVRSRSRVVVTRHNVDQLDEFKALADSFGAQLRVTRLRPSGRGADSWHDLHPTNAQQRQIYDWLLANGDNVLTGDSFFHLNALGGAVAGSEHVRRRPRRVPDRPDRRRLRLPVRDPRRVQGRLRPRRRRIRRRCGSTASCSAELREPQSAGACALVRQLRRLPGRLHGREVLHRPPARRPRPRVRERPRRSGAARRLVHVRRHGR